LLVLVNGAYGRLIARMCEYYGRAYTILETSEDVPNDPDAVDQALAKDESITHVAVVHCETTSGILNPVEEIATVTAKHGRELIIDAMSTFGAIPLDARTVPFAALTASSNKCLQGVPGMGFAIIRTATLEGCEGNSPSLSLDLYDQWTAMEANAQWRFMPPTHVIVAFHQALDEHEQEGGVSGRGARYRRNSEILMHGMREMGFVSLLPDELQAPIILTFHMPADPKFDFKDFYDRLNQRGFVIYPDKLTVADSFRIGCIGDLGEKEMRAALAAIREIIDEMGITHCGPKQSEVATA
ncbi:MAG: 2-aminoethylphosphonate--pyruvate transaminase, partial [Acidiferrobacterales bacterium]